MESHTIEMIGIIIVAVITAIIGPALVEYVKIKLRKSSVQKDPIKSEVEHSRVIYEEIEDIREYLKADRSYIVMYHNGGNFLTHDKSMKKFSMMYENCKNGIPQIARTFTNLPVSLYSRSTEEILNRKHIYISDYTDHTIPTFGLRGASEATGVKSTYAVGLFDIRTDNCIGLLGVDYHTRKKTLNDDQLHYLNERTQRVAGFLSNYLYSK